MNSQEALFDGAYDEFLAILAIFVDKVMNGEPTSDEEAYILEFLIDSYNMAFQEEVDFIIGNLEVPLTEVERRQIHNSSNVSGFARSNYSRVNEIIQRRKQDLIDIREATRKPDGTVNFELAKRKADTIIELIAVSEVQMAITKASTEAAKVIEGVFGSPLVKVWHAVNDNHTCPICSALDGTVVGLADSFLSGVPEDHEFYELIRNYLGYSGGDIPYAHPRCRCWLTVEKAEDFI